VYVAASVDSDVPLYLTIADPTVPDKFTPVVPPITKMFDPRTDDAAANNVVDSVLASVETAAPSNFWIAELRVKKSRDAPPNRYTFNPSAWVDLYDRLEAETAEEETLMPSYLPVVDPANQ
jgi:hypothetical protein